MMFILAVILAGLALANGSHAHTVRWQSHISQHSTIEQALQAACALRRSALSDDVIDVALEPGRHYLAGTLKLHEFPGCTGYGALLHIHGSTEAGAPTIMEAGFPISGWQPVKGSPGLYQASVATSTQITQLWVNGQRRLVARSPVMIYNETGPGTPSNPISTWVRVNSNQLPAGMQVTTNLSIVMYHSWTSSYHLVASIDAATNNVTVTNPIDTRFDGGPTGASGYRYYFNNAPALLKASSGMFYHNVEDGIMQYAPLPSEISGGTFNAQVFAPNLTEAVAAVNASNVNLNNVIIQHTAADFSNCFQGNCDDQSASFLSTATLHWSQSSNIVLHNITVQHTGGNGIWFAGGVSRATLSSSLLTDLGAGAVRIGDPDSGVTTNTEYASFVTIADNTLSDGGHVHREGTGVLLHSGFNNTITHNNITNFYYTGVSFGWTWNYIMTSNGNNTVSFNSISEIGKGDLSDMGCVYHLGYGPGDAVINNYCRNVTTFNYGGWGYYMDQASRFVTIRDNIAYKTKCGGFHQHYGLSNVLINNLFVLVDDQLCDGGIRSSTHDVPGDEGDHSSFSFFHNIVLVDSGPVFYATTNNSFANETFDYNVYWTRQQGAAGVQFPCNSTAPERDQYWLETDQGLVPGDILYSKSGTGTASLSPDGNFCTYFNKAPVWCTNKTLPQPTGNVQAMMQSDGNFCVSTVTGRKDVLYCDMVSVRGEGDYFALLSDNGQFCVHQGAFPTDEGTLWCNFNATQKLDYPTDCSLAGWQSRGQDAHSVVADPLLKDPDNGDFTLAPNSPALKLGFKPIDTSTIGPRTPQRQPTLGL